MLEKKISLLTNNKGNEFLTQLEATLEVSQKLDSVVEAINNIPETVIPEMVIPEPLEEVRITNLPEVQKVEITNLPTEKDDKEQLALLKEISQELKKKEEYAYDIEIDPVLKEQLRGEKGDKGEPGLNGLDGKDGKDADTEEIKSFISKEVTNKLNKLPIVPIGGGRGSSGSSSGGATTFTALTDVPSSYSTQALKGVRVNAAETGLEFFTIGGGSGSFTVNSAEIDFGSVPVKSKRITVTDAAITPSSKIMVTPDGTPATGRVGNDWEWDTINFSAVAGTGNFLLTGTASGRIVGKRKIFYTYS